MIPTEEFRKTKPRAKIRASGSFDGPAFRNNQSFMLAMTFISSYIMAIMAAAPVMRPTTKYLVVPAPESPPSVPPSPLPSLVVGASGSPPLAGEMVGTKTSLSKSPSGVVHRQVA